MRIRPVVALVIAAGLLVAPGSAGAALITNGDFETGSLSPWQQTNSPDGFWEAYTGTSAPPFMGTVPIPPQGSHAAITVQNDVSTQFLYQDIKLPPGGSVNQLSLLAYYQTSAGFLSPENLSTANPNQQYRIDVIKPSAPIDSVASGDVLLNILRTRTGDPLTLPATQKVADLTPFAGQTVRLRFAVVVTNNELNGGVDAVSVKSNGFKIGKAKLNENNGTAKVPLTLPDDGTLKASGKGVTTKLATASSSAKVHAGTVKLLVKPKGQTRSTLASSGKAKVKLSITYTPNGLPKNKEKTKLKLKES